MDSGADGFRHPFEHKIRNRYFGKKFFSEDGGETFIELPTMPMTKLQAEIKNKDWYDDIGEFVAMGNNQKEVISYLQPNNKKNLTYRIWIEGDEPPYPSLN